MALPDIISKDQEIANWEVWTKADDAAIANLEKCWMLEDCIRLIESRALRAFTIFVLSKAHPSWWGITTSSSGRYHPPWSNTIDSQGRGGLIRHTRVVVAIALSSLRRWGLGPDILGSNPNEAAYMRDVLVSASLLHDWQKCGCPQDQSNKRYASFVGQRWGKHTYRMHGEDAATNIKEHLLPTFLKVFGSELSEEERNELGSMVSDLSEAIFDHYGVWASKHLKPYDKELQVVDDDGTKHFGRMAVQILCEADYMSSRKFMGDPNEEYLTETFEASSPAKMSRISQRSS